MSDLPNPIRQMYEYDREQGGWTKKAGERWKDAKFAAAILLFIPAVPLVAIWAVFWTYIIPGDRADRIGALPVAEAMAIGMRPLVDELKRGDGS